MNFINNSNLENLNKLNDLEPTNSTNQDKNIEQNIHDILKDLIQYQSITPIDAGCQDYIINLLENLGFKCQRLDNSPVSNFVATIGAGRPFLMFAGHTDIVPAGNIDAWNTQPFDLTIGSEKNNNSNSENSMYYGRGVADMKGSIAAMLVACNNFLQKYPNNIQDSLTRGFKGTLGFLITSGEEGTDYDLGTPYVLEKLKEQNLIPDYCIVGEPSSQNHLGDMIKIGRRGSLNAKLTIKGTQGHVAYPHLANNPIHNMTFVLNELLNKEWDKGNEYFSATSLQITYINSGGHAENVIPGELDLHFNFRYSTQTSASLLQEEVESFLQQHNINDYVLNWKLSGEPFLTNPDAKSGLLINSTINAINKITNLTPELSTSGGTSDARFIAPYGIEVIEFGPVNSTIHQVNESVSIQDLTNLAKIYGLICQELLV